MKLSELKRKKIPFELKDEDNVFNGYFVSLSLAERNEKNQYYDQCKANALVNTRNYVKSVEAITETFDREKLENILLSHQLTYLYEQDDLVEIENENLMDKDEAEQKRLEEVKKSIEKLKQRNAKASDDELKFFVITLELRQVFLLYMIEEIDQKILTLVTKDNEGNQILSMDENDENYVGNMDEDVYEELLTKSQEIRNPVTQREIRRVVEDPDFLLLWQLVGSRAP